MESTSPPATSTADEPESPKSVGSHDKTTEERKLLSKPTLKRHGESDMASIFRKKWRTPDDTIRGSYPPYPYYGHIPPPNYPSPYGPSAWMYHDYNFYMGYGMPHPGGSSPPSHARDHAPNGAPPYVGHYHMNAQSSSGYLQPPSTEYWYGPSNDPFRRGQPSPPSGTASAPRSKQKGHATMSPHISLSLPLLSPRDITKSKSCAAAKQPDAGRQSPLQRPSPPATKTKSSPSMQSDEGQGQSPLPSLPPKREKSPRKQPATTIESKPKAPSQADIKASVNERDNKVKQMEDELAQIALYAAQVSAGIEPVKCNFGHYVMEMTDLFKAAALEECRTNEDEQKLDAYKVNSCLNAHLLQGWQQLSPTQLKEYNRKEVEDQKRFIKEDDMATGLGAEMTRKRPPFPTDSELSESTILREASDEESLGSLGSATISLGSSTLSLGSANISLGSANMLIMKSMSSLEDDDVEDIDESESPSEKK